jgi:hypothetical protein
MEVAGHHFFLGGVQFTSCGARRRALRALEGRGVLKIASRSMASAVVRASGGTGCKYSIKVKASIVVKSVLRSSSRSLTHSLSLDHSRARARSLFIFHTDHSRACFWLPRHSRHSMIYSLKH